MGRAASGPMGRWGWVGMEPAPSRPAANRGAGAARRPRRMGRANARGIKTLDIRGSCGVLCPTLVVSGHLRDTRGKTDPVVGSPTPHRPPLVRDAGGLYRLNRIDTASAAVLVWARSVPGASPRAASARTR